MLAAGAMLTPGKVIRAGELWMGRPAKKLRDLLAEEIAGNRQGAEHYVQLAKAHKSALSA
jgi:carbonic anhydrase/acetyltransferase-like protein (isoleucine patch superfamily)